MKRYFKLLAIIFMCMLMIPKISAAGETSELSEQQIKNCVENVTLTGCFYSKDTASKYENIAKGTKIKAYIKTESMGGDVTTQSKKDFIVDSIKFDKAYTSINKSGEAVVGLCYKGYVNQVVEHNFITGYTYTDTVYSSPKDSANDVAIIYLRIFNKKCDKIYSDQVIFQDPSKARSKYLSVNGYNAGSDIAIKNIDVTGYEGYKSLTCPKYISFTENLSGVAKFFNPEYEYIFSDASEVNVSNSWWQNFVNMDTSGRIVGCTENSAEATAFLKECYNNKAGKIKDDYTCTSKLTDMKIDYNKYIEDCTNEAKTKFNIDLESARNLANQTAENSPVLKEAGNKKINECYQKALVDTCKLTEAEKNTFVSKLKGTVCENQCKTGTQDQSSSASASCWLCTDTYKWIDSSETSKYSACHPETSVSKAECYGTTTQKNCRSCYQTAMSSLSSDKQTCVLNLISESAQAASSNEQDVDNAFQEHEDNTNTQNAQTMQQIYQSSFNVFNIPGLSDAGFGPSGQDCKTILGNNGVKVVVGLINTARIIGVILAIANGMITLIPAVISKDADGLKKAEKKLVVMAVVLAAIGILPSIIYLIGGIFDFDLSCLFRI